MSSARNGPWPAGLSADMRDGLLARWSEPHRKHHNTSHLDEVLAAIERLADHGLAFDRDAVELGAWYHDAVYDVSRDDNEERSAELARRELAASPIRDEVARLVLATKSHGVADGDANGAALSDADLSVLGSAPSRYATYVAAVREEYAVFGDDVFAPARAKVLAALLTGRMFHTDQGRALWEQQARANVTAELDRLEARRN